MKAALMKNDVLTIAVIVFFVGVLISSVGFSNPFNAEKSETPSALHHGIHQGVVHQNMGSEDRVSHL